MDNQDPIEAARLDAKAGVKGALGAYIGMVLNRAALKVPYRTRCRARPAAPVAAAEPVNCPEGLALDESKFSLAESENVLVLGTVVEPESLKMSAASESSAVADHLLGHHDETVAVATNSNAGAGQPGKKKNRGKKKSAKKSAAEESAPSALPAGDGPLTEALRWAQIFSLLGLGPEMMEGLEAGHLQAMFEQNMAMIRAQPICANPTCGQVGHTLAVCPVPMDMVEGVMCGCFFCNVVTHDADDCPIMEWVTPMVLVTHLITNRAGMPPWKTRLDWVKLAIDNWDVVCFALLPLTREFVKREYIPLKRWEEVKGLSPITDPLFANANRRLLQRLAQPIQAHPLKEEDSDTMCCCEDGRNEHVVYRNEQLQVYLRDPAEVLEEARRYMEAREREIAAAAAELEPARKEPKRADKSRKKGRRALKEAAAVAAAEEGAAATAGPSTEKPKEEASHNDRPSDKDKEDVPVSDRLLELADQMEEVFQNLRGIVQS
ncbi:uncharacterized protein B0T15DRAFT_554022 [Chaetomium strumarium]|uniref:CCHC-type domain-containing protein n=1 Tax=Chaetomium strumarium TaxID=1170767 RepID=A0AAJ0GWL8_9PEZI|nr:hypothetical protein B0T15DRAFT_554022 [Chaetomium strumarium]